MPKVSKAAWHWGLPRAVRHTQHAAVAEVRIGNFCHRNSVTDIDQLRDALPKITRAANIGAGTQKLLKEVLEEHFPLGTLTEKTEAA